MTPSSDDNQKAHPKSIIFACLHIRRDNQPIRRCIRVEPDDDGESGWQMFCGDFEDENQFGGELWAFDEAVLVDPTVAQFIDGPVGTLAWRETAASPWNVSIDERYKAD